MFPLPPPGSRPSGPMSHQPARPTPATAQSSSTDPGMQQATSSSAAAATVAAGGKKKRKRPKKKRNRRESFAAPPSLDSDFNDSGPSQSAQGPSSNVPVIHEGAEGDSQHLSPSDNVPGQSSGQVGRSGGFRMLAHTGRRLSNTSLESEALLDHRDQPLMRHRRESRLGQNIFSAGKASFSNTARPDMRSYHSNNSRRRLDSKNYDSNPDNDSDPDDETPLIQRSTGNTTSSTYGNLEPPGAYRRRGSASTSSSHRQRRAARDGSRSGPKSDYDVNNPPSVPGTPKMGPDLGYDDVMVPGGEFGLGRSPDSRRENLSSSRPRDTLIDIDGDMAVSDPGSSPASPRLRPNDMNRRRTVTLPAEEDVCFPIEGMSEIAEEDGQTATQEGYPEARRRRRRVWPDLNVLNEWSREEKEERSEGIRAKAISEPMFVDGRLRPRKGLWHRTDEDAPYRFTYFNEEFENTIHAQTISELVQPGQGFRELFIPDPPELEDSSSDEDDDIYSVQGGNSNGNVGFRSPAYGERDRASTRQPSLLDEASSVRGPTPAQTSGDATPSQNPSSGATTNKPKRYGPRPTFWLDVLSPTDTEMRVIAKAFGIHALTAEDIMMQEAREKVELFRNYYFINYRSFEQDENSDDYLEPVNMYAIVFRDGVITFHFSQSPHPANVRRRIRQLKDYLILSADWISYALIDDITDVFGPLIQSIEDEVDDIDETILRLHLGADTTSPVVSDAKSEKGDESSGGAMLRQIGECRKKVMGLYRLLGNKADVIKGFAKRCNEQWSVAPKSEIGLYLGDIQDHILTMTSNLSHYETLLSRAHSNYLAQINIRMNERAEQTADVLGKLTVLGTIVLPMNIICGMWGMNVKVPGQDIDNLYWFWSITAGLMMFAVVCFYVAKRVYGIV